MKTQIGEGTLHWDFEGPVWHCVIIFLCLLLKTVHLRRMALKHVNIMYEMSCQSRFDARYWMLGAGALGRPRGME